MKSAADAVKQTSPSVQVSKPAATLLNGIFRQRGDENPYLRIYAAGCCGRCEAVGFAMTVVDGPRADDHLFTTRGIRVVVDPVTAPLLHEASLETVDTPEGPGFRLSTPHSSCTCGH